MALSLQGQIFGQTYGQLIHAGSRNLSGNNIYTPAGCCIPLCINTSTLDYTANGVIKCDLTVNTLLSGIGFANCCNVNNATNSCIFAKCQTIGGGTCNTVLGGLSSYITGQCITSIGTFCTHLTATAASVPQTVIATHDSTYCVTCVGTYIGGKEHNITSTCSTAIGGQMHTIDPGATATTLIGGRCTYMCVPAGGNLFITATDALTSRNHRDGNQFIFGGHKNFISDTQAGYFFSGCGNCLLGDSLPSPQHCWSIHISGKENLFNVTGATASTRYVIGMTGQCNQRHVGNINGVPINGIFPITGFCNCLSAYDNSLPVIANGCRNWACVEYAVWPHFMLNGSYNCLNPWNNSSAQHGGHLLTGTHNALSGQLSNSGISTGCGNKIYNNVHESGETSFIYNGMNNVNCGGSIISGLSVCTLQKGSQVHGGVYNSVGCSGSTATIRSAVWGGCDNITDDSLDANIMGGSGNRIIRHPSSPFAVCSQTQLIVGGKNNYIRGCCCNKGIWGGENNYIDSTEFRHSNILGGRNNRLSETGTTGTSVIGSSLSGAAKNTTYVNNLIITDLPVAAGGAGLCEKAWYREPGSDIIKQVP